ncbi:hypothetical protein BLNAU_9688 [Blattamonas nauphoetae]|uniref:Uncharacterized protein n=1 Tax=Blattamonas nauphoetae TaxID=2049346 RepID=A0ABQ9XUY7_9EUKA|nr:hypothetical protein BLNAU_9688 [Blattamonas nauphoetae]
MEKGSSPTFSEYYDDDVLDRVLFPGSATDLGIFALTAGGKRQRTRIMVIRVLGRELQRKPDLPLHKMGAAEEARSSTPQDGSYRGSQIFHSTRWELQRKPDLPLHKMGAAEEARSSTPQEGNYEEQQTSYHHDSTAGGTEAMSRKLEGLLGDFLGRKRADNIGHAMHFLRHIPLNVCLRRRETSKEHGQCGRTYQSPPLPESATQHGCGFHDNGIGGALNL